MSAAAAVVGVPSEPSRSSFAPVRKKLRQVAFSAPYPSCSSACACSSFAASLSGIGEDDVIDDLGDPAEVTCLE